jgi:hypothetical protein
MPAEDDEEGAGVTVLRGRAIETISLDEVKLKG